MVLGWSLATALLLGAGQTYAAPNPASFRPTGITGSAGMGIATFTIKSPAQNFRMDQGSFVAVSGERDFGFLNLYLNISLGYLTTNGQTNYNYSTLSGENYTGTDVGFRTQVFQGGLGLKLKLIDGYWFRPYVEAGGMAGWFEVQYQDTRTKVTGPANNAKTKDSLLDFGTYAEAGIEIAFSDSFGIRAAGRFLRSQTREFETLNRQTISYEAEIYYLCLLKSF